MTLIAVVDDRITNRTIFSRLAGSIKAGTIVKAFNDPLEVLQWVEVNSPDLIITDYKMPGMDGAEFVRRLRALQANADVPVIVITAYEDRAFRLRALEAGATDFLQSPVDHQEFVTRGRNILKLGQQQKIIRSRADALQRELNRSEESLETTIRDSKLRLLQVIDMIPALISASDEAGRRVFENRHSADIRPLVETGSQPVLLESDRQILQSELPMLRYEEEIVDGQAVPRTLLTSKFPLHDGSGSVRHVLTTSFDITERKQAERALEHIAHHDALTGLPNRLLLYRRLNDELARTVVDGGHFALHLIDLDRFKSINDGFGHHHGDALLKEIGVRLLGQVRPYDMVARLGGDEFAIVQGSIEHQDEADALAKRVLDAVAAPFPIESYTARIGASIGVTLAPGDASTPEQLLKNADLAMYRAKREGRGGARYFAPEMQTLARDTVLLEIDLRQGIENGELLLYYQPQVDLWSKAIVGAESLLRWQRPHHGLTLPGSFLPLAEDTGLIVAIDRWVLHEVCRQASAWAVDGKPMLVGVNLSAATFKAESVLKLVLQTLQATGLDPALLELELTEGTIMQSERDLVAELGALRNLGVRIAVDDFGTGYSSLAYLQRLPIDRLKIDRSFVQSFGAEANGSAIVKAIVGIGRSLNMEVLAEGVETPRQLDRIRDDGCRLAQGFFLGRPVPASEFLHGVGLLSGGSSVTA